MRIGFDWFYRYFFKSGIEFFAVKNPVIEATLFSAVTSGCAKAGDAGLMILQGPFSFSRAAILAPSTGGIDGNGHDVGVFDPCSKSGGVGMLKGCF